MSGTATGGCCCHYTTAPTLTDRWAGEVGVPIPRVASVNSKADLLTPSQAFLAEFPLAQLQEPTLQKTLSDLLFPDNPQILERRCEDLFGYQSPLLRAQSLSPDPVPANKEAAEAHQMISQLSISISDFMETAEEIAVQETQQEAHSLFYESHQWQAYEAYIEERLDHIESYFKEVQRDLFNQFKEVTPTQFQGQENAHVILDQATARYSTTLVEGLRVRLRLSSTETSPCFTLKALPPFGGTVAVLGPYRSPPQPVVKMEWARCWHYSLGLPLSEPMR